MVLSFETILLGSTSGESLGFKDDPLPAAECHPGATGLFQRGTCAVLKLISKASPWSAVDINHLLGNSGGWSEGSLAEGDPVESNERYYRRRAVEERMAAQRAVSETAKAWHAKLAEDFAQRANAGTAACSATATA
jgi:hypothetical protein